MSRNGAVLDEREAPFVLVTGSAGAIGTATMRALHEGGYRVLGFDRTPTCAEGETWPHVQVDVTNEDELAEAVAQVRSMGPLAHVIGIAGGALPGEPDTQADPVAVEPDLFRGSLENNLVGQFLVVRATLPWLRASGAFDQSFTFTSSFNALSAQGMPGYSAAKAGLIGLMHSLVDPLGREGIRVNTVAPGTVRTPRTERLWSVRPGHFERLAQSTATGRVGTPEDVADAFLALLRMRHATGQVIVVDGGQSVIHR